MMYSGEEITASTTLEHVIKIVRTAGAHRLTNVTFVYLMQSLMTAVIVGARRDG